jgi:hypothetical protein
MHRSALLVSNRLHWHSSVRLQEVYILIPVNRYESIIGTTAESNLKILKLYVSILCRPILVTISSTEFPLKVV